MASDATHLIVVSTKGEPRTVTSRADAEVEFSRNPTLGHEVYRVEDPNVPHQDLPSLTRTPGSGVTWEGNHSGLLKQTRWRAD